LPATEAQGLLADLEPDRSARVAFILGTGARWGESDRARAEDIDLERCIVRLRGTKTKTAERGVPIVGFVVDLLDHALRHCEGKSGLLFRWDNVRRDSPRRRLAPASAIAPRTTCGAGTGRGGASTRSSRT
jgi:integrase